MVPFFWIPLQNIYNLSQSQNIFLVKCSVAFLFYRLAMYRIGIKDALYFTVIGVVVLEIFSKITCFIDGK